MPLTNNEKSIARRDRLADEGFKELRGVYVPKESGKELKAQVRAYIETIINR